MIKRKLRMNRRDKFEQFTTELQTLDHMLKSNPIFTDAMMQFKIMLEALATYLKCLEYPKSDE